MAACLYGTTYRERFREQSANAVSSTLFTACGCIRAPTGGHDAAKSIDSGAAGGFGEAVIGMTADVLGPLVISSPDVDPADLLQAKALLGRYQTSPDQRQV